MASEILSNSASKLNHPRREIAIMQDIILAGNRMARVLQALEPKPLPKEATKAVQRWTALMIKLAESLF